MWILIIFEIYLYFHHIGALVNLALGKQTSEGLYLPSGNREKWIGEKAVDGLYTNRSAAGGQCVIYDDHSVQGCWRVDLGGVVSISHIDIYYRTENMPSPTKYTSRMAGFFLYVSNTTSEVNSHLCFHEIQTVPGTPLEDQSINCSVHGRYVFYCNERRPDVTYPSYYSRYAHYELCEVEVYGCSNAGYFGSNCSIPCPTNCQERRCDVNTGHCLGCLPGYQGLNCDEECESGYFGPNCTTECGHCLNASQCHNINGTCLDGCSSGYTGSLCTEKCSPGSFGIGCIYKCNTYCSGSESCDYNTGICDEGCKQGWKGPFCDKECESGYFGPNCTTECGHCLNASQCHNINGTCLDGCSSGYTGSLCTEKCSPGSFGINCMYKCNTYCSGSESCDSKTGVCDEGCKQGWKGPFCDKECEKGYFGADCTNTCGHCLNASQCHRGNGTCLNGCSAGYMGSLCKEKCPLRTFGLDCLYRCNLYCTGNASCHHVTGVCNEGCKRGWKGPLCNDGGGMDSVSRGNNDLIAICIVVPLIIVFIGSAMNYIYWRRNRVQNVQERQVKELSAENNKAKTSEKPHGNVQHYTELQEVNPYEDLHAYAN